MALSFIGLIKDSWKKTILNPSLGLFLVLFLIAINFLATFVASTSSKIIMLTLLICIFLSFSAFFSGWFYLVKKSVETKEEENKINFSTFIEGVGKNTGSTAIATFLYITILSTILITVGQLCYQLLGSPEEIFKETFPILQDTRALSEYLNNITPEKRLMILSWESAIYISASIVFLFFFFYVPSLISKENANNFIKPFLVFKDTFKFLFKNFLGALGIFILIQFLNLLFSVALTIFSANNLLSLIFLFAYIYFIIFAVMLVFNYYEQKNNSDNRCNSVRENECSDSASKEA